MNTDQIAAEAAHNLWPVFTTFTEREHNTAIIKAAIEKATDPFRERINTLVSELDTIWHEGRAYEQKFGVKPHASDDDAERLDWWIALNRQHRDMRVYECETPKGERYWCCELHGPYERFTGKTPREAIDAAMRKE